MVVVVVGLTLASAAADLPEAGALAQTIEPLLLDQLHDLRLDLLPQLSVGGGKRQHAVSAGENHVSHICSEASVGHAVVMPTANSLGGGAPWK